MHIVPLDKLQQRSGRTVANYGSKGTMPPGNFEIFGLLSSSKSLFQSHYCCLSQWAFKFFWVCIKVSLGGVGKLSGGWQGV